MDWSEKSAKWMNWPHLSEIPQEPYPKAPYYTVGDNGTVYVTYGDNYDECDSWNPEKDFNQLELLKQKMRELDKWDQYAVALWEILGFETISIRVFRGALEATPEQHLQAMEKVMETRDE